MACNANISALSPKAQRRLVYTHLEELDTPRSLAIYMILEADGFDDEVLNLEVKPSWFIDSSSYLEFAVPTSLVKKWTGLHLSTDPEEVAFATFLRYEELCRTSNRRIRSGDPTGRVGSIMDRARKIVHSILPEVSRDLLSAVADMGGWGKGSTSSCKGRWVAPYNKLGAQPQATPAFLRLAEALLREHPSWSALHDSVECIPGNTLGFVPKTAKTHRGIAVEPSMNCFVQKGIGSVLEKSLRRLGIDLRSQKRNQRMAYRGSKTGELATVDLSGASDTICTALVEWLLPPEWFMMLSVVRSEKYFYKGTWSRYEKFSSMGNGFTFALETLIFSSICAAIVGRHSEFSVYGDDIIVPCKDYGALAECLEWCGFIINPDKSFHEGPFRESCGSDYFDGDEVRPFFLKEFAAITPMIWANSLRKMSCYKQFKIRRTWLRLVGSQRKPFFGPDWDLGLVYFVVNDWEIDPTYALLLRRPYGPFIGVRVSGWRFQALMMPSGKIDGPAAVAAHLWSLKARDPAESYPLTVSARESGSWVQRRTVFSEDWPMVRAL